VSIGQPVKTGIDNVGRSIVNDPPTRQSVNSAASELEGTSTSAFIRGRVGTNNDGKLTATLGSAEIGTKADVNGFDVYVSVSGPEVNFAGLGITTFSFSTDGSFSGPGITKDLGDGVSISADLKENVSVSLSSPGPISAGVSYEQPANKNPGKGMWNLYNSILRYSLTPADENRNKEQ
jgi:hypothetical protein